MIPAATVQCAQYFGAAKTARRETVDIGGSVQKQIARAFRFVADRVREGEIPTSDDVNAMPVHRYLTSPVYLTDLDYSTADDDNYVEVGLASIAGKRYKKSFRVAECMSPEITVAIPTGLTQLTGVVGYDDESGSKDGSYKVQIEETTDADPAAEDVRFTRLDVLTIPSGGRRAALFQRIFRLAQPAYGYLLSNMPAALPSHGAIQKSLNTLATSI